MGRIGIIKTFERRIEEDENVSEVKIDVGGGEVLLPPHFATPGTDSTPLPGDYVATTSAPGADRQAAVGYADPVNEQVAEAGETRIYARDTDGILICEIWLKKDGSIVVRNENGNFELKANGQFNVNGGNLTVDP